MASTINDERKSDVQPGDPPIKATITAQDPSDTPVFEKKSQRPVANSKPKLITYDELPAWYQDNPHIHGGYRPESFSTTACLRSLLYLHNETVNIYSHLLPAPLFLLAQILMSELIKSRFPDATQGDYLIFSFFLVAAFVTLILSSLYHTMTSHSMRISHIWLRLDFVGILVLTLGDFVSGIYLVFYCHPSLQKVYWSMIAVLGFLTGCLVAHPRLQGLKWRALRVAAFISTGLSGLVPLAHGLVIHGWYHMWMVSGMPYYLLEGGLLFLGAILYSSRCPESLRPGGFDIWGCSHNIFHVLVVLATTVHLIGIWESLKTSKAYGGCLH